jgi:fatty acid desaturase
LSYKERPRRFDEEIDAIRSRVEADLGAHDVIRIRRLNGFSRGMEVVGRTLIHFSLEPFSFLAGVGALWIHKQLQTTEIGHTGQDVADFPEGTRANGKGEWYAMQVEATNNFEVSRPISILCGGLNHQIEHHLFPKLPPDRLRKITLEVRAVGDAYGVSYRTDTWWRTLKKALTCGISAYANLAGRPFE